MNKTLLIIFAHSPTQSSLPADGLDVALTAAILGTNVKLLLLNSGCEILYNTDAAEKLKQIIELGCNDIYANSINSETSDTSFDLVTKVVDSGEVRQLINNAEALLGF